MPWSGDENVLQTPSDGPLTTANHFCFCFFAIYLLLSFSIYISIYTIVSISIYIATYISIYIYQILFLNYLLPYYNVLSSNARAIQNVDIKFPSYKQY